MFLRGRIDPSTEPSRSLPGASGINQKGLTADGKPLNGQAELVLNV
jgi:hypothetical protein